MENLLNQLIDIPEMQRVAQEVENLTPELAESVKEFYNQLSALSSEARAKIISDVGKVNSGALIEDMKKQDEEIQKRIKESRNKYLHLRGFELTKGYIYGPNGHQAVTTANAPQALENAFKVLQVRAESVFYDIEKKAEEIGGEAGD
jgi:predicted  nucleic acid-binding Zn-ribbon protein